ncbi:hypothetical protein L7F22_013190 [Adiantum nelumboides]|nr:hypothetical protein [Adiantum nelumboides]
MVAMVRFVVGEDLRIGKHQGMDRGSTPLPTSPLLTSSLPSNSMKAPKAEFRKKRKPPFGPNDQKQLEAILSSLIRLTLYLQGKVSRGGDGDDEADYVLQRSGARGAVRVGVDDQEDGAVGDDDDGVADVGNALGVEDVVHRRQAAHDEHVIGHIDDSSGGSREVNSGCEAKLGLQHHKNRGFACTWTRGTTMDLLLGDILYEGSSQSSNDDSANESFNVGEMVDRDFEGIHENNMPDPFKHLSSLYFSFDRKAYGLMVRDLKGEISVSLEMLKACDVRGMLDLKKWRRMKDTFGLAGVDNGSTCIVQQTQPKVQIACIEDWGNIVKAAHCVRGASKHKSLNDTIEMLRSTWSIDVKRHGIPISYVKDFVNSCRCSFSSSNHTIDLNKLPMTTLITTEEGVAVELENIMIEHKTRIVMARSSKKEIATKHVIHYVCHRGVAVQHCSKEKRSRTSKKCGCPFKVRLEYVNHRDEVRILINPNHEGHMPGSRADLYHLPVHPTVVESCLNDLFDVGSSRHVAQMSLSKERLLFERAPLLHRVIYRFFMIPKEVQMLSYKTRTADQIHDDDWATMYMEAKVLQNQGKVLYCQPYNPTASDPKDRPFILILQDEWMLEMGIRFSANNAWAIDSTFKTNKYGLPLFAAVLPNQLGVGIPIWFMLCTCDVGARHEVIALEITIKRIFSRMANVRPSALVIDKSQQELDALLRVVNEDPHCWEYTFNGTRRQIACHVLLCWFHTKKAWVEHLLPQVPKEMREDVYSTMCNIMHSVTEVEFEDRFQLLRQRYSSYDNIVRYVTNGWCGRDCMWRVRWPQFGRLFLHGNVDTTN